MLDDLLTQIRTLSSGTLATLTGRKTYEALDKTRELWLVWAMHQPSRKMDWQESWRAYSAATYVPYNA